MERVVLPLCECGGAPKGACGLGNCWACGLVGCSRGEGGICGVGDGASIVGRGFSDGNGASGSLSCVLRAAHEAGGVLMPEAK